MSGEKSPLLSRAGENSNSVDMEKAAAQSGSAMKSASAYFGASVTTMIIIYYACCSSTMLIINKVAIHHLPTPAFLLLCQLSASAIAVKGAHTVGWLDADKLEWSKARRFMWVVVGFLGTIFTNMKVLQHTNVETFITFRSTTPLVLSICDYIFLGRQLPNARSWSCLFVLVLGSAGYVLTDTGFSVDAYFWLCVWYVLFTVDTVYVKHMCESVKMTNWGRVYYTNLLAVLPLLFILPALNEQDKLMTVVWNANVLTPLILSCLVGVAMSHASYLLRDSVSATLFTIVGILCKIITVIINCLIWDKHASMVGIGFLLLCVLAGTFYQQAPKRT